MKFRIYFFLLSYFFVSSAFSQNGLISEIDQTVIRIKSNLGFFEKVEKINSEEGSRDYYFKEGKLQLISIKQNGKIEKYVQWFYYDTFLIYTETNWLDSLSGKNLYLEKTYHDKGNLVAWLNSESTFVDSSSPEFKKTDRELKAYSIKIRNEAME